MLQENTLMDSRSLTFLLWCSPAVACVAYQASGDAKLHCVPPGLENLDHCIYMGQEPVRRFVVQGHKSRAKAPFQ